MHKASGLLSKVWSVAKVIPLAAMGFFAQSNAVNAETRTLKIYHVHLNERSVVTFKRDGKYLSDGLNKLNRAVRDWRRNEPTKMDPRLFDVVWEAYNRTGATGYINVIGGYRSAKTNSMLRKRSKGVAEKSQHVLGKAMDFYIPGVSLKKLRNAGLQSQYGGVGYYPSSGSPFVHMDVGNVRHWPRMSRSELMAVFPTGKTVHIPSDGRPLAGYDVALAQVKSRKSGGATFTSGSSGGNKSLFAILFGGGADEEEDIGSGEETAIAAASPKPTAKRTVAQPIEPLPLPENPAQPVIVATLPKREQQDEVAAPRPETDVNALPVPEALAFAVPVPQKKPRFASAAAQTLEAQAEQVEIADAINAANATPVSIAVSAVPSDPEAESAAIASALGRTEAPIEAPFIEGAVPVPARKPKTPETLIASVAVPQPRPVLAGEVVNQEATPQEATLAETMLAESPVVEAALAMDDGLVPIPASKVAPETETVASLTAVADKPSQSELTLRTAMLENGAEGAKPSVKTTRKSAKPKSSDAKPAMKTISKAPTPKVGKFALSNTPVTIANQPIAPDYAQALIRSAPNEVMVSGFSNSGPQQANKFSGKAVNFLRVAKFDQAN